MPVKPNIHSRESWSAQPASGCASYGGSTMRDLSRVYSKITVHHDADVTPPAFTEGEAKIRLRSHQNNHFNQEWCDIGYHYLISPGGHIYAGRSLFSVGAHVEGHNTGNVGVSLMGGFHKQSVTPEAEAALVNLLAWLCDELNISTESIYGHRDFMATECPGANLYNRLPVIRTKVDSLFEPKAKPVEIPADDLSRLKVFGKPDLARVILEGEVISSVDLRIQVKDGKPTITLNGKKIPDMRSLTVELVRDHKSA